MQSLRLGINEMTFSLVGKSNKYDDGWAFSRQSIVRQRLTGSENWDD